MLTLHHSPPEFGYRVQEPDAPHLYALATFPNLPAPRPETDTLLIRVYREDGTAALGRGIRLCGRQGLLSWYAANVGYNPDQDNGGPHRILDLLDWVASHLLLRAYENAQRAADSAEVRAFQRISESLLNTHYGITLNDTALHSPDLVSALIASGETPIDVINEHAREAGLDRIDDTPFARRGTLTLADEAAARRTLTPSRPKAPHG